MHTDARGLENACLIGRWTWCFRKASNVGGMILKKEGGRWEDDVRGDKLFLSFFFFTSSLAIIVFIERKQRVVGRERQSLISSEPFFFLSPTRHPLVLFAAQSVS
jgi:hypothetical protein